MTNSITEVPTERRPITYVYVIDGKRVGVTRRWAGQAYARNGNVHNPTQYYRWEVSVDGKLLHAQLPRRSSAYEYGRAFVLGIDYSEGVGPNMRGCRNVRDFRLVEREMKENYSGRSTGS